MSSGISYPAELIVLSSSKCPWEEIFASWRRVGFLGCRISPLWHLASSLTRANINCCVDLQSQSCLEGRQSYSAFHMDRHKGMKHFPAQAQQRQCREQDWWKHPPSDHFGLNGPSQPCPNSCCTLEHSEDFHFFLLFILPSNRPCSVSQLQRSC